MNKQFLLLFAASTYITASISATDMNAERLIQALLQEKITIGDHIFYDRIPYTVEQFAITKNEHFYDITCTLSRPLTCLGTTWGNTCVKISAKKGIDLLLQAGTAGNTTIHNVSIRHHRCIDEGKVIPVIMLTVFGSSLAALKYC